MSEVGQSVTERDKISLQKDSKQSRKARILDIALKK